MTNRFYVSGVVHDENGNPACEGTTVFLYRRGLRRRAVLGTSVVVGADGTFRIDYGDEEAFSESDRPPHIELRAFDAAKSRRAVSEVFFCPPTALRNVSLRLMPGASCDDPASEFDRLSAALESAIGRPNVTGLSPDERDFAAKAICDPDCFDLPDASVLIARLAEAEQSAVITGLSVAATYGILSMLCDPVTPDLSSLSIDEIKRLLEQAVKEQRIPPETPELNADALARLAARRAKEMPSTRETVRLRLLDAATGHPIRNAAVSLAEADEPLAVGALQTDKEGRVVFFLAFPDAAPRVLTIRLCGPLLDFCGEEEITLSPGEEEREVRIAIASELRPLDASLAEIADSDVVAAFAAIGINTVGELLLAPDVLEGIDPQTLTTVRRRARWHAAGVVTDESFALEALGFDSPIDVARLDRARFVELAGDRMGGLERAASFHAAARLYHVHVARVVGDAWLQIEDLDDGGDDPEDDPDEPDFSDILDDFVECGCDDCESALSPGAYLAHMLDWITTNVTSQGTPVTLEQLEDGFHQPFGELPTTCDYALDKLPQARLAVEVLWRFTGGPSTPGETVFNQGHAAYRRAAYRDILASLGVTYDALLVAQADDPTLDTSRAQLAGRLGVAVQDLPSFVLAEAPSEAALEDLFGLRRTDAPHDATVPLSEAARLRSRELGRLWLAEDGDDDAYGPTQTLPAIDPRLINETAIRPPRDLGNPVFALYSARRDLLDTIRSELETAVGGAASFLTEIAARIGTGLDEMRAVRDILLGTDGQPDPDQLEAARTQVRTEFFLDLSAFLRLMEIADLLDTEGDAALADAALATDGVDILLGQQANSLRQDWIDEEVNDGIRLDSALFQLPDLPETAPSDFLIATNLWTGWRLALVRRSGDPVIDPHHLTDDHIVQFVEEGFDPFATDTVRDAAISLLDERRDWAEGRRSAFSAARTGAGGGIAGQYAAVIEESVIHDLGQRITDLLLLEEEGHTIEHAIAQLAFSISGFRRVVELGLRAAAGLPLLPEQWDGLFAVLIGAEKRMRATEWRAQERDAGIALHPRLFRVPEESQSDIDSGGDPAGDANFARAWSRRLTIRDAELAASLGDITRAVAEAEQKSLPILRDALIRRATPLGESVAERRAYLDSRLLIALDLDGCACTTRIAFATETLQRFLRGILRGDLIDALANVEIDAENIAAAESLLSYQEWRSAIFAFLWPENLTSRVLPGRVSHGLNRLVSKLPNRLTPEFACKLAKDYEQYFRDICGLVVSATCFAPTFMAPDDPCDPEAVTVVDRLFLFGHAEGPGKSGQVYWATLDPAARPEDTRTTWSPLGKLGPVDSILGATVHVGAGKPFLLLLVRDAKGAEASLRFRAFDLDAGRWLAPRSLAIPSNARAEGFEAAILRKYARPTLNVEQVLEGIPTLIALQAKDGGVLMRRLDGDFSGWADGNWFPLQGPSAVGRLRDLVQVRNNEAALILESDDERVTCRTVGFEAPYINDDFTPFDLGDIFNSYGGAIGWPQRQELIAFTNPIGETRYRIAEFEATQIGIPDNNPRYEELSIVPIEERLREELGVSLDDTSLFAFEDFKPFLWTPKYVATHHDADSNIDASNYNPLNTPGTEEQGVDDRPRPSLQPFSGSLYELLTMTVDDLDDMLGDFDNQTAYIADEEERSFFLIQYKKLAIDAFFADIDELTETDPYGDVAYWWGFLDDQIKRLSQGQYGLRSMITQVFHNSIGEFMVLFNWDLSFEDESVAPVVFEQRLSDVDVSSSRPGGDRLMRIASTAGYDHMPGESLDKPIALWKEIIPNALDNGSYWTVLSRSGSNVVAIGDQRIAPDPCGAFSILPPKDRAELIDRRAFSEEAYASNPDAPPSVRSLFRELFFLVPVVLGDALCASGYHREAQEWFRTCYDEGGDPDLQKIDYGLVLEENRPLSFTAIDDWLRDPEDVHSVALTRRESDTRRALLSIIACMIAEADALFARDLPETISEARHLYRRALELLARLRRLTGSTRCSDIIGTLRFELEGRDEIPIGEFTLRLAAITDPGILRTTVDDLVAVARDSSLSSRDVTTRMRDMIAVAVPEEPQRRPVTEKIDQRLSLLRRAEARILATERPRALLSTVMRRSDERRRDLIDQITAARDSQPDRAGWLTARRDPPRPDPANLPAGRSGTRLDRVRLRRSIAPVAELSLAGLSLTARTSGSLLSFCIPQNPEIVALARRAETALDRIRACRDIAGYERITDPYGGPIGLGSLGLDPALPEQVDIPPVPLRYGSLLPRAMDLAETAAHIEGRYLHALEGEDRERLNRLQVTQNLEIAEARISRSVLAVSGAEANVELARRQRDSAVIAAEHYDNLIQAGPNVHERRVIDHYLSAGKVDPLKKAFQTLGKIGKLAAGISGFGNPFTSFGDLLDVAKEISEADPPGEPSQLDVAGGIGKGVDTLIELLSAEGGGGVDLAALEGFRAELERREETWNLQRALARQDIEIGLQEIAVEQLSLQLAQADLEIAELQRNHAADMLTFLQMKNLTAEAYRWMATILGESYREVLQRAAATGRMAERALAFERFERPAALVAGDYWQVMPEAAPEGGEAVNLRGLTGSARLLRDLVRLQDHAVASLKRRVPVEVKIDLTRRDPESFRQFRDTGVLEFETTLAAFQEQLPGYYAASIMDVSLDLQAITLPSDGLRMTLESRGISRAVIRTEGSRTTIVRGLPEVRYLTGTPEDDLRVELTSQGEGLRGPFEGTAFAQFWRIRAEKGANPLFDYEAITGLTFTIRGTALYSPFYAEQVRRELGPVRSGDVILSLRRDYPAAWAALQEAAAANEPLVTAIEVPRSSFPVNLEALTLDHLLLAVLSDDEEETPFDAILFSPSGGVGAIGGGSETVDGRISTRNATGSMLRDLLDGSPVGQLELRFGDAALTRIASGEISDVVFVLTYSGEIA